MKLPYPQNVNFAKRFVNFGNGYFYWYGNAVKIYSATLSTVVCYTSLAVTSRVPTEGDSLLKVAISLSDIYILAHIHTLAHSVFYICT